MSYSDFRPPTTSMFSSSQISGLLINPPTFDISSDSCPPSMYLSEEDYRYLNHLKTAKPISMTLSNIEIMNQNEPQCIFTKDPEKSEVILKNCSKAIQHKKKLSDGKSETPLFFNNLFQYNPKTKHILSMNKRGTCLYVAEKEEDGTEFISQGPCYDSSGYLFHFNNNKQIVSEIYPGPTADRPNQHAKCITARNFIQDMSHNLYSRLLGTPVGDKPTISLYLDDCYSVNQDAGIFSPDGDQQFNYGELPVKGPHFGNTGMAYVDLEKEYRDFEKNKVAEYQAEIAKIYRDIAGVQANIDRQTATNNSLLRNETDMKKKEFTNIQIQTNLLREQNAKDSNEKTQNIRKTGFQQVQQDRFQYLHKVLFWIYYVMTALFTLVFMIRTSHILVVKVIIVLLLLTYPFAVFVLEYYAAFAFYYSLSFIQGKPYDGNKNLPLDLSFYKPGNLV